MIITDITCTMVAGCLSVKNCVREDEGCEVYDGEKRYWFSSLQVFGLSDLRLVDNCVKMIVHDDIGDNESKQHSLLLKVMDNLAFGVGFQKQFIKAKIGVYCIQCGELNIIRKVSSANVREKICP